MILQSDCEDSAESDLELGKMHGYSDASGVSDSGLGVGSLRANSDTSDTEDCSDEGQDVIRKQPTLVLQDSETEETEHERPTLVLQDSETEETGHVHDESGWEPGERLQSWTDLFHQNELAQMLAANVLARMRQLPLDLIRQVINILPSVSGNRMAASLPARAASALLRLPAGQIARCVQRLRRPLPGAANSTSSEQAPNPSPNNGLAPDALEVLVDLAIGAIDDDLSYGSFVKQVARLAKHRVNVGQKYHSVAFMRNVE